MRKYLYLAYDLACVCSALVIALYLRHGFPLIQEGKPGDIYMLLAVTAGASLLMFSIMQTHTSMWRFTSTTDLARIMIAVALIILISNSALFLISRLEMMPRSVPPMQWALAVLAMSGTRVIVRKIMVRTSAQRSNQAALKQHVIVVGACQAAELYLQFIKRIVQHPVIVEGFVDSDASLTNRMFQKYKILGTPEDLPRILEDFNVHGIQIKRIVLAKRLRELSKEAKAAIVALDRDGGIELVHFAKYISPQLQAQTMPDATNFYHQATVISPTSYEKPKGLYPYVKRGLDLFFGLVALALLSPLIVITALLVALDVGFPILFWQQRPGLYGKAFRLYKFRTMRPAGRKLDQDRLAHKSGDSKRTSIIGKWIRRLRLDELPQLFHIITGTMSFVGPRPLLPDDQPQRGEARLSVRPGATGWAQIHGGDALTPEQKLVLDIWYIRHMSFWLDIKILLKTLIVVLGEDKQRMVRS